MANLLEGGGADRAARPRCRHGTGDGPSAGRGNHGQHGLGWGPVRSQPRRWADLLLRAVPAAGGDDHPQHRGAELATAEAHFVRDRRSTAVLLGDAVDHRVGGEAADASLRGGSVSAVTATRVRRADRASASWRLSARLGLGLAWLLGLLFCAIAAAIVIYFLVEGIHYLRPSLVVTNP